MHWFVLFPIVALFVNTIVWAYVLGQRKHEPVNRAFLLFSASTGGWLTTDLATYFPSIIGFESILFRIQGIFWVPIGFLFLNFAYALVGRKADRYHRAALLVSLLSTLLFLFTDFFVAGYEPMAWGISQNFHKWPYLALSTVPASLSAWGISLVIGRWRRATDPFEKKTLRLVLVGGMATLIIAFTLNTLVPAVFRINHVPRLGSSALALFSAIVLYAVTHYRFLSISVEQVAEDLFEDIQDGVLLINRAGIVERENRAAQRLLSLDTTAVGMRETDLFESAIQQTPQQFEFVVERSGTRRILSVSAATSARSGTALGRIVILRDITASKQAEDLLRNTRDDLVREVEERNEQLRHSQRIEAIGTFAGAIAHDFNNLLAAILGFANAARNDVSEDSSVRQDLDEVILAGKRAREIVHQLLTFSRRQDKTDFQVLMIQEVITEALGLLRVSLPTSIQINCDMEEVDGAVRCDPTQIGQVIMNLATNAFHAMENAPKRCLSIELKAIVVESDFAEQHPPLEAGDYLKLTVSDTGAGMNDETLARVFDPFFTTKEKGEGTGLGLSTALGIIKSHDGTITVESEVGKGSRFSIYLPEVPRESRHSAVEEETVATGRERILFIDDETQLLRMSKRLLEPLGYRITLASKGPEALDILEKDPTAFDVILTDQTMPEMTGLELAKEILERYPSLPVVIMSGGAKDLSRSEEAGDNVRAFLRKPISASDMSATIRSIMDEQKNK